MIYGTWDGGNGRAYKSRPYTIGGRGMIYGIWDDGDGGMMGMIGTGG
jgi:hypothetical protein